MPYRSNDNVSRLLQRRSEIEAERAERSGAIWGNAFGRIGEIATGAVSELAKRREEAPQREYAKRYQAERLHELDGDQLVRGLVPKFTDAQTGRIDFDGVVKELRVGGYPELADKYEQRRQAETAKAIDGVLDRVRKHEDIFGKGAQILQEVQTDATMYPKIRPQLVELAGSISPGLVNEIPETYDPERVKSLLQFAMDAKADAVRQVRGTQALKAAAAVTDDNVKRAQLHSGALADWFSTAKSAEDWQAWRQYAQDIGIDRQLIAGVGDWSPDAPQRANLAAMSPKDRFAATQPDDPDAGQIKGTNEHVITFNILERIEREKLKRRLTGAERGAIWTQARAINPNDETGKMNAQKKKLLMANVLDDPERWLEYTDTVKSELAGDLHAVGFKFPSIDRNGLATAERFRKSKVDELDTLFRTNAKLSTAMTVDERDAGRRGIEDSYRIQIGKDPLTDAEWQQLRTSAYGPLKPVTPASTPTPSTKAAVAGAPPPTPPRGDITLPAARPVTPSVQPGSKPTGPAKSAPMSLPADVAVGDTFISDGQRMRVASIDGRSVSYTPIAEKPKKGDIVIYNGERWRVGSIDGGKVTLDPPD